MFECRKTVLPNGLRLVTEKVPGARAVALGFWVAAGSLDEPPEQAGLAHLIEHLVFKGTRSRSTLDIAREIDLLGGQTNAFTTKELTSFHTKVMAGHLDRALDLLWDIFRNSVYDEADLEREKDVVCQEIAMLEDCPEELVFDILTARRWPDHPLGWPIIGSLDSVAGLGRPEIMDYLARNYRADRVVLAAAGAVEHEALLDFLAGRELPGQASAPRPDSAPETRPGFWVETKKLEQSHLALGLDFPAAADPRRYAASVLNVVLGGNMSSRLFQEIRERRGLAYSVYSSYTAYRAAGDLVVYAGAAPDKIAEVRQVALAELDRLTRERLSPEELAEAKEHLAAGTVLSGESLDNRMSRLARNELIFGRQVEIGEIIQAIEAVAAEEARDLARSFWSGREWSTCVLGPVSPRQF